MMMTMSPYKQQQSTAEEMSEVGDAGIVPGDATSENLIPGQYDNNNSHSNANNESGNSNLPPESGNIAAKKLLLNDNNSNHTHNQHYQQQNHLKKSHSSVEMGNVTGKQYLTPVAGTSRDLGTGGSTSPTVMVSPSRFSSYSSSNSRKAPVASLPSTSASHHHLQQPSASASTSSSPQPSTPSPSNHHTSNSTATTHRYSNGPMMTTIPASVPEVREYLFKLLMIGELGTGKTSFIKRYVHQYFSQHYRATIGVDFALKVLNWDENSLIRLQLWDIAGQERFGNMTRVYYKEAVGAFLAFDVNAPQTFQAVLKWKHDLDTKVCLADGNPIPCLLLANKCDAQKDQMDPEMLDKFVRENGFCGWFYTSAKDNINVEQAAKFLVGKILQRQKHFVMKDNDENRDIISLNYSTHSNTKSAKSCAC